MEAVNLTSSATTEAQTQAPIPGGVATEVREFRPLYDRFNAVANPRTDRIFEQIWSYAKEQAPEKDKDSILWEISKLSNKLGSVSPGEKPWIKLISYVSTHNQMRDAEKRLKEMETVLT